MKSARVAVPVWIYVLLTLIGSMINAQSIYCLSEDCITCYVCEMSCPAQAIYVHPFKEALPLVIEYKQGGTNE